MTTETLTIARLGSGGDGIAEAAGGPVYVPFTLPGETAAVARVKNHGTVMSMSVAVRLSVEPSSSSRTFSSTGMGERCGVALAMRPNACAKSLTATLKFIGREY